MKKILILPLFVMVTLISQAWGAWASCASILGDTYYCQWDSGCHEINQGANDDKDKCNTDYRNCRDNGYMYTGVTSTNVGDGKTCNGTWAGVGNDPNFHGGVAIWCQWATGCESIKDATEFEKCISYGFVYKNVNSSDVGDNKICKNSGTWTGEGRDPNPPSSSSTPPSSNSSSSSTPSTIPSSSSAPPANTSSSSVNAGGGSSSSGVSSSTGTSSSSSVVAGGSSSSVVAGGSSSSGAGNSSSSVVAGGSSSSGAGNSSSSDNTPIISHNGAPVVGLNVVNFARSLRIASDKNATISLFDINGKLVLSQKVLSGTTTISLANQKSGVYYAVAKSSSQKQIVKIVLK